MLHLLIKSREFNLGSEKNSAFTISIKQSQIQDTGFGNNYNPVAISETKIEFTMKKIKDRLKLLGSVACHSRRSSSLELRFLNIKH